MKLKILAMALLVADSLISLAESGPMSATDFFAGLTLLAVITWPDKQEITNRIIIEQRSQSIYREDNHHG